MCMYNMYIYVCVSLYMYIHMYIYVYVHKYGCAFVKLMNLMVGPVECVCVYEWLTLYLFSFFRS